MNREAIYSALFDKLAAISGLLTTSRRLRHWADVPAQEQPAMFLAQVGETPQTTTGQPSAWLLRANVYLYVHVPEQQAPGPVINPLLDAVCRVLNEVHPVTGRAMLCAEGVQWCRVEGAIETDEGTLGNQAVAVIPVAMLAA